MTPVVIDASAGVEMLARTVVGSRLRRLLPRDAVPWVPDGLFDVEVLSVLRRWELRSVLSPEDAAAACHRLTVWRLRRAAVVRLRDEAWTMRYNVTFTDACYVALARRRGAALLTGDHRLRAAPNLPVRVLSPPREG